MALILLVRAPMRSTMHFARLIAYSATLMAAIAVMTGSASASSAPPPLCGSHDRLGVNDAVTALASHRARVPFAELTAKRIDVPVYFHVLYDSHFDHALFDAVRADVFATYGVRAPDLRDGRLVTPASVDEAVRRLNDLYNRHQIAFHLRGVRFHDDPLFFATWSADAERAELMRRYAVDPAALNVFVRLTSEGTGYAGKSTLPWRKSTSGHGWSIDLDFRTMPGVSRQWTDGPKLDPGPQARDNASLVDVEDPFQLLFSEYNPALAHEVGHALGLFHTFSWHVASPVTPDGAGDLADDTPEELQPFFGDGLRRGAHYNAFIDLLDSHAGRNSVDDSYYWKNGRDPVDPITNLMDYGARHLVQNEITNGQAELMFRFTSLYLPHLVTRAVPSAGKPRPEALMIYADFEAEDLTDGRVTNKAPLGQMLPIYVKEPEASSTAALAWGVSASAVDLQGSYLEVRAPDLFDADITPLNSASTLATWFKIDDAGDPFLGSKFNALLAATGVYGWSELVAICPEVPGDPDWAFMLLAFGGDPTQAQAQSLLTGFGIPRAYLLSGWHHLAIVADGDLVRLYLDGWRLVELPIGPLTGIQGIRVGSAVPFDPVAGVTRRLGFHGAIDELAVFRVALSDAEVVDLMMSGAPAELLSARY